MANFFHKYLLLVATLLLSQLSLSEEEQLDFKIVTDDDSVCQVFSHHGERTPALDQCVPRQGILNQHIEVTELVKILDNIENIEELKASQVDPLDVYDVSTLPDAILSHIINTYVRLDINNLSIIEAKRVIIKEKEEVLLRFVASADWKNKSGKMGVSYVEGEVLDIPEDALKLIIENSTTESVINMLATYIAKNTNILRVSSEMGVDQTIMSNEDIYSIVAPVISMELTFVLNLRLLRATIQSLDIIFTDEIEGMDERIISPALDI